MKKWNHTVTTRVTQFYQHQTLRFSAFVPYNTSNHDYFVNPELRYNFTDKVWGAIGLNLFGGKLSGQFGQFSCDDNVYVQVRYEF